MSTSGTVAVAPSSGGIVMQAFRRIGVPRSGLTAEMMLDAQNELNFLASEWANSGPNLWAVDKQGPFTLVQGQQTLALDPATIDVLDLWITVPGGTDRALLPMSRSAYADQANKLRQGQPSSFWFDRLTVPTLTLWPVPSGSFTLSFFRSRQMQDAVLAGGVAPETPFRFLDALVWCLAERLAYIYAEAKVALVGTRAQRALADARAEDTEDAPVTFSPMIGGYFR